MNTIYADYNARTEAGHVRLTCLGSEDDIRSRALQTGDWVWLSDTEVVIGAQLAIDDYYGLVGLPDWDTIVHLDDDDVRDFEAVRAEIQRLSQKPQELPRATMADAPTADGRRGPGTAGGGRRPAAGVFLVPTRRDARPAR